MIESLEQLPKLLPCLRSLHPVLCSLCATNRMNFMVLLALKRKGNMFTIYNFIYSKPFFLACKSLASDLVPSHCSGQCNAPPRSPSVKDQLPQLQGMMTVDSFARAFRGKAPVFTKPCPFPGYSTTQDSSVHAQKVLISSAYSYKKPFWLQSSPEGWLRP